MLEIWIEMPKFIGLLILLFQWQWLQSFFNQFKLLSVNFLISISISFFFQLNQIFFKIVAILRAIRTDSAKRIIQKDVYYNVVGIWFEFYPNQQNLFKIHLKSIQTILNKIFIIGINMTLIFFFWELLIFISYKWWIFERPLSFWVVLKKKKKTMTRGKKKKKETWKQNFRVKRQKRINSTKSFMVSFLFLFQLFFNSQLWLIFIYFWTILFILQPFVKN